MTGEKPKISIIIPVYNGSNYMKEAIDSALNQTYDNCEVIVVNDGSTDNTEEIALSYGDKIRYFYKENGGVGSALNVGIKEMKGEYFSWLSHDDVYLPDKVEVSINAIRESGNEYSLLYAGYDFLEMNKHERKPCSQLYYDEKLLQNGLFAVMENIIHGCTVLIHKQYFEQHGLFDETLQTTQDYDMWFRIFRNRKVIYLKQSIIYSRIHDEQGSKQIKRHLQNCDELHYGFISRITDKEAKEMFGDTYTFYYHWMEFYEEKHFERAYEYVLQKLKNEKKPSNIDIRIEQLKKKLYLSIEKRLCLYCAGQNGRVLKERLMRRRIKVDFFSDCDEKKQDMIICGIPCVPLDMIDKKRDVIIVTKDNPQSIQKEIKEKGYRYVITYDEIKKDLCMIPGCI